MVMSPFLWCYVNYSRKSKLAEIRVMSEKSTGACYGEGEGICEDAERSHDSELEYRRCNSFPFPEAQN